MSDQPNYPASFYARLFNLSERRIQQMAKEGVIPKSGRGKYPLIGTVQAYVKFLQQRALNADRDPDDPAFIDPQTEQAKLNQAKRVGQELINDKITGNLFPIDAAEYVIARMAGAIAAILDSLPAKIKRVSPSITATGIDTVKKEIAKARNAAADVPQEFDEYIEEYYSGAAQRVH